MPRPHHRAPVAGSAVELAEVTDLGDAHVETRGDRLLDVHAQRAVHAVIRRRHPPASRPLAVGFEGAHAERGIHRQDLGVADMSDRTRLRDLVTLDGDSDVDVHDGAGPGVRQVLRRRPHDRPLGRPLHGLDRRAEARAAEQEPRTGGDARRHRKVPSVRVVARLQAEEGAGVHESRIVGGDGPVASYLYPGRV